MSHSQNWNQSQYKDRNQNQSLPPLTMHNISFYSIQFYNIDTNFYNVTDYVEMYHAERN